MDNIHELMGRGWKFWDRSTLEPFLICPSDQLFHLPDGTVLYDLINRGQRPYIVGVDKLSEDSFMGLSIYGIIIQRPRPPKTDSEIHDTPTSWT